MSLFSNENPVLGTDAKITQQGSTRFLVRGDNYLTDVNQTTYQSLNAQPTLAGGASQALVSGATVVGVRGQTNVASGTTITGSYIHGVHGYLNIAGSLVAGNSAYQAGVFAQLNAESATSLGSASIQALWVDCRVANITASAVNAVSITGSGAKTINSVINVASCHATYLFDLADDASGWIVATAKGSGWDKSLKIRINGTTYYIPCNSAAS